MRHASVVVLASAVLLGACASDDPVGAPPPSGLVVVTAAPVVEATAPEPPGGSTLVPPTTTPQETNLGTGSGPVTGPATAPASSLAPTVAAPDPDVVPTLAVTVVGEAAQPVDLAARAGDPAAYVVEQAGVVIALDVGTGTSRPVLDVTDLTDASGEQGLLGLAFHPSAPYAYVNYTTAADGATVVAEYALADDGTFDPASARELLRIEQPYSNHNGGGLAFGPDGYLYIGTGDGGSGGDPERRASDPFDLLGKLLRIDPRAGDPYAVPADNPFADGAAAAPEVWSLGLRNPWRFAFDPPTGDLWIADVGQNELEEVNRVPGSGGLTGAGANFGWSAYEGTARFNTDVEAPGAVMPVLTYGHGDGCSISGGTVHRGTVPALAGWYVFSDYCAGTLWGFDPATGRTAEFATDLGPVTAVRPGPDGETYVLTHDGRVLRVGPA